MSTNNIEMKISTLWIVVMLNILSADIVGFMNPGDLMKVLTGNVGINITQELLLIFSILMEIPIAMVFLSRVLKPRLNRWGNRIACLITIAFVIAGGDTYLSYIFFAAIEIMCMLLIIWYTWKWPDSGKAAVH
jgi:Sec-independent protein secretion pathway component TatC